MIKPDTYTHKNGLKIAFLEAQKLDFVSFHLRGFAGSNYEKEGEIGAAHLLEHVLLSTNNKKLIDRMAEIYGLSSRDTVLYHFKLLPKDISHGLDFVFNLFKPLKINMPTLQGQKLLVINELRQTLDNPEKLIGKMHTYNLMYPNTRLEKFNFGDETDIVGLTAETLENFHIANYQTERFVLCITGSTSDIKSKLTQDLVASNTSVIPKHTFTPNQKFVAQVLKNKNLSKAYIKIDWPGFTLTDKTRYPAQVAAVILTQTLTSTLRKRGEVYNISVDLISEYNYGLFGIYFDTTPNNITSCFRTIQEKIKNFNANDLKNAIEYITTRATFNSGTETSYGDFYSKTLLYDPNHTYEAELETYRKLTKKEIENLFSNLMATKPKITGIGNFDVEKLFEFDQDLS